MVSTRLNLIPSAVFLLVVLPLAAYPNAQDQDCITTVGDVSYPPYEWGAGSQRLIRAEIQLGSGAHLEGIRIAQSESGFGAEVKRSLAVSTFDVACQGRKLSIAYRFQLVGEESEMRNVVVSKDAVGIRVSARPAVLSCNSEATNENDAAANVGRGDRLLDGRKWREALQCAESALPLRSLSGVYLSAAYIVKGVALRKLDLLAEAIAAYDELERMNPTHPQVHFNRANAYRDSGNFEAAIRDYTAALDMADEPHKVYANRGNTYLRLKRFELARNDYQKAAELAPDEPNPQVNLCVVLNELGAYQDALAACDKAIELDPSNPTGFSDRAVVWTMIRQYDNAIRDGSSAIRLDPLYFEGRLTRGIANALAEHFVDAEADLTEAIRLQPNSGASYLYRALVRRALGNAEGARSDREKAEMLGTPGQTTWFVYDPVTGTSKPVE